MKKHIVIILAIALTSCLSTERKQSAEDSSTDTINLEVSQEAPKDSISIAKKIPKDSIWIENRVMHAFSDIDSKDEFYVCIKGESIFEGKVIFKIAKSDGTELLNEEFLSIFLVGYEFEGDHNSEKEQEEFMIRRIKEFFDEKNFFYPAIHPDETFDEDYSDKDIWDEIEADKRVVGFYYLIGEEDGRKIAFSKKKGKAVIYFNCC